MYWGKLDLIIIMYTVVRYTYVIIICIVVSYTHAFKIRGIFEK